MSQSHPEASRRQFLATTMAVAGAGALISRAPAWAMGTPSAGVSLGGIAPPGPDEPIRMAVIGTGGMGTGHCEAFLGLAKNGKEKVQIVALADVCQPRLDNAKSVCDKNQSGVTVQATRDYREILGRKDVHAVLIASPEHWHSQHAIDAITSGKDVYCEKPMTLRFEDAMALRSVVLKHPDRIFQVGTQFTQHPKYAEARKVIKSGMIGETSMSQTSYCRNSKTGEWTYYEIDPNWKPGLNLDWDAWCGPLGKRAWSPEVYARWRRFKDYSTGIVGDLLVHVMTPMIMALDAGWPVRVTASGHHIIDKAMENHDQVNLNIEFENGHTMVIAGSTCNENGLEAMIRGHKGNIFLGGRHCVVKPERIWSEDVEEKTVECPDIGNDQDVHRLHWMSCIRSRQPSICGIDLGSKVMVAVDMAARSMWDGHAYRFDPKTLKVEQL